MTHRHHHHRLVCRKCTGTTLVGLLRRLRLSKGPVSSSSYARISGHASKQFVLVGLKASSIRKYVWLWQKRSRVSSLFSALGWSRPSVSRSAGAPVGAKATCAGQTMASWSAHPRAALMIRVSIFSSESAHPSNTRRSSVCSTLHAVWHLLRLLNPRVPRRHRRAQLHRHPDHLHQSHTLKCEPR